MDGEHAYVFIKKKMGNSNDFSFRTSDMCTCGTCNFCGCGTIEVIRSLKQTSTKYVYRWDFKLPL